MNKNIISVQKRNKEIVPFDHNEIYKRIESLVNLEPKLTCVNINKIVKKVISGAYDNIKTSELDNLSIEISSSLTCYDNEYNLLAARIAISNLYKNTPNLFSECIKEQYNNFDLKINQKSPLINDYYYKMIMDNADIYNSMIDNLRDYNRDYLSFKTLEKSYLKTINFIIIDRPSYMYLRVAIQIYETNFEKVKEIYDYLTLGYFSVATPILFNSLNKNNQLASCFLIHNKEDSIDGIFDTYKNIANISKYSGGIGIAYSDIRASQSYINGTNGFSKGIFPFIKIINDISRAVDQGGKRNGAFAIYLEPWHADVISFLKMKSISGDENQKCRDLFPAMWIPDLFFQRVEQDKEWSLFCPKEAPGLSDCWGKEFEDLYCYYESIDGLKRESISAKRLFKLMINAMVESGLYICSKDNINRKSNQKNLGTIKCSNLCTEIVQYATNDSGSVCVLSSIGLPKFIKNGKFDYDELYKITRIVTRILNIIIDKNHYPPINNEKLNIPDELINSNDIEKYKEFLLKLKKSPKEFLININNYENITKKYRPIGIGVQGLADVFMILKLPFESNEAAIINKDIFETIYFAALSESIQLAKETKPYESYNESPISKGIYQFNYDNIIPSNRWDWKSLDKKRIKYGVRNSLLTAPMPTKSTSHILGYNECLVGNTRITLLNGLSRRIDFMNNDNQVFGWNGEELENSTSYKLFYQGNQKTIRIILEDNRFIICTPKHKFLKFNNYWEECFHLSVNDEIICGIKGIFDHPKKDELFYELQTKNYIFSFKNFNEREKFLAFSRILGYITSKIILSNKQNINDYFTIKFDYKFDLISFENDLKLFNKKNSIYEIIDNDEYIIIILDFLKEIILNLQGFYDPDNKNYNIPNFLLSKNCPKSIIREYLAGFHSDNNFNIILSNNSDYKLKIDNFYFIKLNNINILLKKFNIKKLIEHQNKLLLNDKNKYKNFLIFIKKIGVRYNIIKTLKFNAFLSLINILENNLNRNIKKILNDMNTLNWFIDDNFFKKNQTTLPFMKLKIKSIKKDFIYPVWDISVNKTQSFIASGIVVHNCFGIIFFILFF